MLNRSSDKPGFSPHTLRMPGAEQRVQLREGETRFFRMGEGPPLILLHGLGESSVVWFDNMAPLAASHTVYAVDLPGHGGTFKPLWDRPLEQSVQFMVDFMDALDISTASMLGNSVGGLLALATGLQHPQRVDRLVLEGSAGLGREIAWFLRLMTLPMVGEALARPSRASVRRLLQRLFYNHAFSTQALVEALYQTRRLPGNKRSLLFMLRDGVSIQGVRPSVVFIDQLPRLDTPTLLVWGRNDLIFPVSHAERAAQLLPNAKLAVFDHCGHRPHVEVCRAFNRLVLDFLA